MPDTDENTSHRISKKLVTEEINESHVNDFKLFEYKGAAHVKLTGTGYCYFSCDIRFDNNGGNWHFEAEGWVIGAINVEGNGTAFFNSLPTIGDDEVKLVGGATAKGLLGAAWVKAAGNVTSVVTGAGIVGVPPPELAISGKWTKT